MGESFFKSAWGMSMAQDSRSLDLPALLYDNHSNNLVLLSWFADFLLTRSTIFLKNSSESENQYERGWGQKNVKVL